MAGAARSLQNCLPGRKVRGGFDSHAPPPRLKGKHKNMPEETSSLLGKLPSISKFLNSPEGTALCNAHGCETVKFALRQDLASLRKRIRAGEFDSAPGIPSIASSVEKRILRTRNPEARHAINASGILLHTGLGRAPLCEKAVEAISAAARHTPLQLDLENGTRALREEKVEELLRELTGCEAATVLNNNAAATMLLLNSCCAGRETILSRGQLIEIGGEFRMPDVMARSGTLLREIGTTNKTHLRDYEKAVCEQTAAILHVHTSNYRIRGFSSTPDIAELCKLKKTHPGLLVLDDLGSGALLKLSRYGVPDEPLVADSLQAGADLVCFSGDKLICGPQSGIICGRRELVEQIRKNPFARMFRVCKLTLAAMEATLSEFVAGSFEKTLPLYAELARRTEDLECDVKKLSEAVGQLPGFSISTREELCYMGSGSAPDEGIPGRALAISASPDNPNFKADDAARAFRKEIPPVFCRIKDEALLFETRTLLPGDLERLSKVIRKVLAQGKSA